MTPTKEDKALEYTKLDTSCFIKDAYLVGYAEAERVEREKVKKLVAALEFYANGPKPYDEQENGDRLEFGCGCCAGIADDIGSSDHDEEVMGLTAREALKEYRGEK